MLMLAPAIVVNKYILFYSILKLAASWNIDWFIYVFVSEIQSMHTLKDENNVNLKISFEQTPKTLYPHALTISGNYKKEQKIVLCGTLTFRERLIS